MNKVFDALEVGIWRVTLFMIDWWMLVGLA